MLLFGEKTRHKGDGRQPHHGAARLLRRLRIEFIAVNMALATLVLAGAFTAICYMDYRSDIDEVYRTLSIATRRAIEYPQMVTQQNPLEPYIMLGENPDAPSLSPQQPGNEPAGEENPSENGEDRYTPFQIGGAERSEGAIPVAVYYCESGSTYQVNEYSSAAVPVRLLSRAITHAEEADGERGYLDAEGLFFARRVVGPVMVVAFADSAAASAWKSLALVLALVGVGALGVLFLLNLVFSRWALNPVLQAWTQQQQFIADASHELKTPLTVILANNAILRERGGETIDSQLQWIDSTQTEAERMQGLVTDMLDLARASAATENAPREPLDFSHLVEGEELTFEAVAFEHGVQWKSAVDAGITVRGDERKLQRLVAALLDNACKYTPVGGTVQVRLSRDDRWAVLAVRNSGDPIAPEDLKHLFDRFYRADKARTHNAREATAGENASDSGASDAATVQGEGIGTTAGVESSAPAPGGYGLGLAIARGIAEAHKGVLTATSTVAEGTTFTLKLPLP